jgi:hypothetical protein
MKTVTIKIHKYSIVVDKRQAGLYGVLLIIPMGIPIIILIESGKYFRKRLRKK